MKLNEIRDNAGARPARTRVGRGIGSGKGKQSGRGGKGQTARSGVRIKGFEGGQMPLHRRLPKRGFNSAMAKYSAEVRLSDLEKLSETEIDLGVLKNAGVVPGITQQAKVIKSGKLSRKLTLKGIGVTKGAREAIAAAGGSVAE